MNQNFTSDQLIKLCKKNEIGESGFTKDELIAQIDQAFSNITNGTFDFNLKSNSGFYIAEGLVHTLILRKLNDNLKRLYKDEQSNRRIIINQVTTLLEDTCPFWILRTDISKFYESIDRERLMEKLQGDSMLSYFSLWLIKRLFSHSLLQAETGLPRGITISSTLSEIYMRKFDRWIKGLGVYYFGRFVDDIIIFSHKKEILQEISQSMNEHLESGLNKNISKTAIFDGNRISNRMPLEYLGYQFLTSTRKNKKSVVISISKKKIKKIKSRIIYSFIDYIEKGDFVLLENRIKFLTGNYSIRSTIDGNDLRAGIYYNYISVNDKSYSVFTELNVFFKKTLHSKKYSFGKRLSCVITTAQRDVLSRYSFKHGFLSKVYYPFNASDLREISSCWK